jgi:hypothetical protein
MENKLIRVVENDVIKRETGIRIITNILKNAVKRTVIQDCKLHLEEIKNDACYVPDAVTITNLRKDNWLK